MGSRKRAMEFGDAHLADAFSAIRDEALEEAAKIVEQHATSTRETGLPYRRGLAVAAAIRSSETGRAEVLSTIAIMYSRATAGTASMPIGKQSIATS